MRILIDTQIFLWLLNGDQRLTKGLEKKLLDKQNPVYISIASLWEIDIKVSLNKLDFDLTLDELLEVFNKFEIQLLPLKPEHTFYLRTLEFHHKDPFDRILVAQAVIEDLNLMSSDVIFDKYLDSVKKKRIYK